ncbi:MAG: hypothetical protein RIG62_13230 [Cyclobacteriaceae bacterium]
MPKRNSFWLSVARVFSKLSLYSENIILHHDVSSHIPKTRTPLVQRGWGQQEGSGKVLLGKTGGERYLKAAREHGKKTLWLIENHNMAMADARIMDQRLPEVIAKGVDQLIYYYYPRNLEDPDKIMNIIARHVKHYAS